MDLLSPRLLSILLVLLSFHGAKSTFSPSGSVSIDCGGQQTFTCTLTANGPAAWTITGLQGIAASATNGVIAALNNARITSAETVAGLTSTITITGFTTADNGGIVQCSDQAAAVEGSATVMIGVPSCSTNVNVTDRSSDFSSATITWDQPTNSPPVTSYDVTCNSSCTAMPCTSGSSTCRVLSVSPCEGYSVTVLPMNSCGSSTGCTENSVVVPSQGVPSCPANVNVNVIDRSSNFSSATITWEQPTNSPSVTSYDVTCNPSCTAMPCTSGSSTCRVLSLSPCEDYSVTVLPMNSCGNSTGCTENIVAVPSQGPPQCGLVEVVYGNDSCPSFAFTLQGTVLPSSVVVSYELVGGTGPSLTRNCDYPVNPLMCELVVPEGTYTVRLTPQNNCGSPSSTCSSITQSIPDGCRLLPPPATPPPSTVSIGLYVGAPVGGVVGVIVVGVSGYGITILIMGFTCYSSLGFLALLKCLCCPCSEGKARKSSSKQRIDSASPVTPPAQPPAQAPSDEYADPQAIRDRKEKGKEDKDKIQYAAIDFSAGAGSGAGEVKIHQKEEPVIYTTVQHV